MAKQKHVFVLTAHDEDKHIKSKKINKEGMKPILIDKYNQFMGGVDVSDKCVITILVTDTKPNIGKSFF